MMFYINRDVGLIKGVMHMKITEKADYSYLFNSLNNNSSNNSIQNLNLSDYASIKNGSYTKLLKAYYAKENDADVEKKTDKTNNKVSEAEVEYTNISNDASKLREVSDKLIKKGTDSLFNEVDIKVTNEDGTITESKGYDKEKIYNSINDFVNQYNKFIKRASDSDSTNITRETQNLTKMVSSYGKQLSNIGITINNDNSLKLDEAAFKKSDMNRVKSLFQSNQSFAYLVSTRASLIGTTAESEKNKAKNYTSSGNYSQSYSAGNILNSII